MGDDFKNLVPSFIVHINGTRIPPQQEGSVKRIVVNERVDSPATCSLFLSDSTREWTDSEDYSEGSELKITLGYKDDVAEVFCGEITGVNPQFRENSDDLLVVKAKNKLHRLARGKKTCSFSEVTDADIIKEIVSAAQLDDDIDDIGQTQHIFTMQRNQTDYEYISMLARKHGCKIYIKNDTFYFKKADTAEEEEVIIEWGKTLLEFNVQSDTSEQLSSVEVRGWDNENGEAIVGTAELGDIKTPFGGEKTGGALVDEFFDGAKMILIDENVIDQQSADELAKDILNGNSMNYVTGSGKCEGNHKIKVGTIIELKELGGKFSGKYFVNSLKHVFNTNSGFITHFTVSRNAT